MTSVIVYDLALLALASRRNHKPRNKRAWVRVCMRGARGHVVSVLLLAGPLLIPRAVWHCSHDSHDMNE